ncbi:MAG: VWA domain-containing protein [Verrucomicrobiota bacterium]
MKIVHPWVLFLLLLIPLLAFFGAHKGKQSDGCLRNLVADRLRSILVGEATSRRLRFGFFLLGVSFALLALLRPQWGEISEKRNGFGRDVIIAVDVSRSMLASDLPPSRLRRAKLAAEDLVHQFRTNVGVSSLGGKGGITRIGIVAFAGSAFLQAPVTSDYAAVLAAIQELDPDLIPLPGTNISEALRVAVEAFDRAEGGQRALILISDGEDLEADGVAVAKELAGQIRVFTMGVGTPEGTVLSVPSPRGGMEYIRDKEGNVVQSRLDESRLSELAQAGGGFYTRLQSGPAEMRHIVEDGILLMEQREMQQEGKVRAIERYQWPLGIALLLLSAGMLVGENARRRSVGVALVLAVLWPEGAFAKTGRELYEAGDYAGARTAYESELARGNGTPERSYNLGTAAYKTGNWSEAIESFGAALASEDSDLRSKAEYNFANALVQQARQGRRGVDTKALGQAVEHYDEALRRNPAMEDAVYNRDVVRKLLAKKEEQKKKDEKKDKGEKQDNKNEEKDQDKQKEKQDQSSDEKKEDKGENGEENKDGKDGKEEKDKQAKDQKGKQGKGDDKSESGKSGEQQDKGDKKEQGSEPRPEEQMQQKPKGELKNDPVAGEGRKDEKEKGEQQVQAGDGKLTREQAAALIEALRSEDRRVQLWTPNLQQQKEARGREGRTW